MSLLSVVQGWHGRACYKLKSRIEFQTRCSAALRWAGLALAVATPCTAAAGHASGAVAPASSDAMEASMAVRQQVVAVPVCVCGDPEAEALCWLAEEGSGLAEQLVRQPAQPVRRAAAGGSSAARSRSVGRAAVSC